MRHRPKTMGETMSTPKPLADALKFGQPLHDTFLTWLKGMANRAANGNEEKHAVWNRVEMTTRLYADPDEVDGKGNLKNPYDNLVVIPWARVNRDTLLGQIWLPWAERDPFVPLSGREPDDIVRAQLMAQRCQYDVDQSAFPLTMYAWLGNAIDFGFGCIENYWVRDRRVRVRYDRNGNRRELIEEYEGNYPGLLDPFRALPDPEIPVGQHQMGGFFGYSKDYSHAMTMRLATRENDAGDSWFNVEEIRSGKWTASEPYLFGSRHASLRNRVQGLTDPGEALDFSTNLEGLTQSGNRINYHILTTLEVVASIADLAAVAEKAGVTSFAETLGSIMPPDQANGRITKDDLQYWKWTWMDGRVIVDCEPQPAAEFCTYVVEADPDLLSRYTPGKTELAMGLQDQINRVINQHNANIDRGVYGVTIVDDDAVNLDDFRGAMTGGIVRKNPEFSGDLSRAVIPLPWQDATRQNLSDIPMYSDMMQRLMGVSDQSMGQVSQGRRAAYDVASASAGANARARVTGKLMALQGINRLLKSMIRNIQLYDTQERWVRVTGALEQTLRGSRGALPPPLDSLNMRETSQGTYALISAQDVQGDFDIAVLDGRPTGPDAQKAQAYSQTMQILGQMGAFAPGPQGQPARFDPMWFVKRFAEEMGIRNLRDAELMPAPNASPMMPPEQLQAQNEMLMQNVQQGNLAPVAEGAP